MAKATQIVADHTLWNNHEMAKGPFTLESDVHLPRNSSKMLALDVFTKKGSFYLKMVKK